MLIFFWTHLAKINDPIHGQYRPNRVESILDVFSDPQNPRIRNLGLVVQKLDFFASKVVIPPTVRRLNTESTRARATTSACVLGMGSAPPIW